MAGPCHVGAHVADAVGEGHALEPVVHVIVHLLEHTSQHRTNVVPDDAHVVGIVVQVEQMYGIRVHHCPVDVEQCDVAWLPEQPESADAAPAFDDARLVQARGQFADVAGVGAYAHSDLLGIDRSCGLRDQDQRMDCGRESGVHHYPFPLHRPVVRCSVLRGSDVAVRFIRRICKRPQSLPPAIICSCI